MLFSAVKKVLSLVVSLQLLLLQPAFAETAAQRIKSRDEIKVILTSSEKYTQTAGIQSTLAWSLVVIAVGRIAYGFGKNDKGLKSYQKGFEVGEQSGLRNLRQALKKQKLNIEQDAFERGFTSGKESMTELSAKLFSAGKKKGYNQGLEQGLKQVYSGVKGEFKAPKSKAVLTKAERQAVAEFESQVRYISIKLSTPTGAELAKNKMMILFMDASNKAEALKAATNPQDIAVARNELLTVMERIRVGRVADSSTRKVVQEYLKELSALTRAKGGAIGMAAAGVVALAAMFALSQQTQAADISNTRLLVERELSRTIKQTPELISVKALSLKNTYGVDMVASVLYEHQEVLPELTKQLSFFESAEIRQISSDLIANSSVRSNSVWENKNNLLNSLRQ